MKTTSYILLNKGKKSNYHQITHLICFCVLIINFADINNFPLLSQAPTYKGGQSHQEYLIFSAYGH